MGTLPVGRSSPGSDMEDITHVGADVITSGALVGAANGARSQSSRLILLWEFDATQRVTDIRVFEDMSDAYAASRNGTGG